MSCVSASEGCYVRRRNKTGRGGIAERNGRDICKWRWRRLGRRQEFACVLALQTNDDDDDAYPGRLFFPFPGAWLENLVSSSSVVCVYSVVAYRS
uniref:Uncharacterized protein n=1 Tax=Aegilops tauschii subsp. strangulata TaxID=200361 RepID=A0A453FCS8_AEGTS